MLNLLHISDLHYTAEKEGLRRDYSHAAGKAILSLAKELKEQGVLGSSLAVVITGDLVQSGSDPCDGGESDFEVVQKEFLKPLQDILGFGPERFFLVPGNHEMDREAIDIDSRQSYYRKHSEAAINADLNKKLKQFFDFVERYQYNSVSSSNPRIATFEFNQQKIVCLNGLAGAYSRQGLGDKGELFILPTEMVSYLSEIDDFSIVLTHHPLSWYCDECEVLLRDYLSTKRIRLLTGHIHNEAIGEYHTEKGSFVTVQAGASSESGSARRRGQI